MIAESAILDMPAPAAAPVRKERNGKISLNTFLKNYRNRDDGFKYEYHEGYVIKSPYTMNDAQQHIAKNLLRYFLLLELEGKTQGFLGVEKDSYLTSERFKVPDLVYLSPEDEYLASNGGHPLPKFVIEIVSWNDTANYYDQKLDAYFEAGVQVVWMIYPETKKVVVHYKKGRHSKNFTGKMICSAAPVLPQFALPVKDIFVKPPKPAAS